MTLATLGQAPPTTRPATYPSAEELPSRETQEQSVDSAPLDPGPGNLVIEDIFLPTAMDPVPHGNLVTFAAAEVGTNGVSRILNRASDSSFQKPAADPSATPQQKALAQMDNSIVGGDVDLLNHSAARLQELKQEGVNHGAVNLSMGSDKADTVKGMYVNERGAWDQTSTPESREFYKTTFLDPAATAFGLDESKLLSNDAAVAGPERMKLQQALIARVNHDVDNNPDIAAAKQKYDTAVHDLSANKESVVVAAGNGGELVSKMKADNGGHDLQLPDDFYSNPMSNGDTVTAGAVSPESKNPLSPSPEAVAPYSNPSSNVAIYADGTSLGERGTSFAAPRVAGALAQLHRLHPDASNADVLQMLSKTLTHPLNGADGKPVGVLDDSKAQLLAAS